MKREDSWRVIAGSVALLIVLGLLLSTPSMIFVRKIDIVDSELRDTGANPQRVLARFDLNNEKELAKVPTRLGQWNTSRQYQWDSVATLLNTNVLLSRDYLRDDVFQPVNLLIIDSKNVSSFHPAPVCYRAQGWDLPSGEGVAAGVLVPNVTWAQQQWLSKDEENVFSGNLSAKLLEATKSDANGTVTEKRAALYVYLKREDWRVTDEVTWVRVEMGIAPSQNATDVEPVLADLLASAVPELFSFKVVEERTLGEQLLAQGPVGFLGVAVAVAAPVGVVAWPFMRRQGGA